MKKTRKSTLVKQSFSMRPGPIMAVLGLVFLGGGVMLNAGASTSTTTTACKPVPTTNMAIAAPGANEVVYTVASGGQGGTATASVKAGANCVGPMVSLVTYQTPNSSGNPLTGQTIFDSQTKATTAGQVDFSVKAPDCFYQIDLVYGQPLDLHTGQTYHGNNVFLWGVVGGMKSCVGSTPKPSVPATATPEPSDTPKPTHTPKPTESPRPTVVAVGSTPSPTPSVIPLGPGESAPPTVISATNAAGFLPHVGTISSLMTYLGAILITGGLFHIYLTQRRKLITVPERD